MMLELLGERRECRSGGTGAPHRAIEPELQRAGMAGPPWTELLELVLQLAGGDGVAAERVRRDRVEVPGHRDQR